MWTRMLVLAAAALVAGAVRADETFSGDMTTYTLGQPSAGNCNFMDAPAAASQDYAAINNPQWADMKNCGRCALVSCTDARCADQSKTKLVYILDQCPECKQGDLDVSPSVFKYLTGSDPSRYKISWKFVDCPVAGNIKYCLKGGSNPFWTAIQPTNMAAGVRSMTINSQPTTMVTSAYYYLLNGQSTQQTDLGSVRVTLTSVGGESVTDTVSLSAGSCTEGSYQFASGGKQVSPGPAPGQNQGPPTPVITPAPTSPPATQAPTKAPTQAPVPSPSPSATQSPSPRPTPSTTPSVSKPMQQNDNSTVAGESRSMEDLPGSVRAANDESMSSRDAERHVSKGAANEAGVLDAIDATPAPTPSASADKAPSNPTGGIAAGGVTEATTKSGASTATSPAILILSVMGVVGVIALTVVAIMVRRKKIEDKNADREDAIMVVNLQSFDTPENTRGASVL